jgi:hypothetical protein
LLGLAVGGGWQTECLSCLGGQLCVDFPQPRLDRYGQRRFLFRLQPA